MDRRNSLQRGQLLEGQLQEVRSELSHTLDHLEELRDVLQRSQLTSDQRQATIDKLATELRWAILHLDSFTGWFSITDMDAVFVSAETFNVISVSFIRLFQAYPLWE